MNDRTRNWHHSTWEQFPDGSRREVKHPFPCDDCREKPAIYGCVEAPGLWLRCVECHLERLKRLSQ